MSAKRARGAEHRTNAIVMEGVIDAEGFAVELDGNEILAFNEGGHNWTSVSLDSLVRWLMKHRPDLWRSKP